MGPAGGRASEVAAALAAGEISESFARTICAWTDKLPEDCRPDADEILLGAAPVGEDLRGPGRAGRGDLRPVPARRTRARTGIRRSRTGRCKLETTFEGAGVLTGDLSPECASIVGTVLDALSAPAGAEDDRSQAQRYHDALHEALQRLVTAGLLPERAGQPVKAWVHMSLADLMVLDGSSALQQEWTSRVRAAWAAHRAEASAGGSDGGAWLDGDAAAAMACDAAMAPFVTGEVNPAALEDLVRLCVQLDRLRHHSRAGQTTPGRDAHAATTATARAGRARPGHHPGLGSPRASHHRQGRRPGVGSGRAGVLPAAPAARRPAGGPSLPLDIGYAETIPAGIRNAVILRDQHCQWAGRCNQPASACQVHHVKHKANGGHDQRQRLRSTLLLPPSGRDPPVGLDPGPEPRRHHHRVEPGQDQGPAQPRTPGPPGVTPPARSGIGNYHAGRQFRRPG